MRCDSAGNAIPASEVEPLRALRLQGRCSLGFESASILVCTTYGDTVDDGAPVVAGSSVVSLVWNDDDWNLGDTMFSRNDDVHARLQIDFSDIQTRYRDLSLAIPDKAGKCVGLALCVLMHCRSRGDLEEGWSIESVWGREVGEN